MPICLPRGLPAASLLRDEGVAVHAPDAASQPGELRVGLLNLMPNKPATELHFARALGRAGRPVRLELLRLDTHRSRSTPAAHLDAFYTTRDQLAPARLDGLIITGAPLEDLDFEDVSYWRELQDIFDWAAAACTAHLYICWAAQAALYHRYGIRKHLLDRKAFGVFEHRVHAPDSPIVADMGARFPCPVSRHAEVRWEDLIGHRGLRVAAAAEESGIGLIEDHGRRSYHMLNHLEYEADTLGNEYFRDRHRGVPIDVPRNYFPDDHVLGRPARSWGDAADRFYANWLNEAAGGVVTQSARSSSLSDSAAA
jgi:homoserine O-succinyltransferase